VAQLAGNGVDIRALMRTPEKARSPHGAVPVKGDPSDVDAMRAVFAGVSTVFLLVPNVPDELTQGRCHVIEIWMQVRRVPQLRSRRGADFAPRLHGRCPEGSVRSC
jgi:uncharacterized protein YbjT (DUF2867 family)